MAEALFKSILQEKQCPPTEWVVQSAACWASGGFAASPNAILAMRERGLDISAHVSQPISEALLDSSDLILCMEYEHRSSLRHNFPQVAGRVFLLSEIVGEESEIWDPVGYSLGAYRRTADQIKSYLQRGFDRIMQLTQ